MMIYHIAVIGGGPAGAAAAITAARSGATVLLLERGRYPRHKVCGEFISAESLGLLSSLVPSFDLLDSAPRIGRARIFADGRCAHLAIKPAGASLPRFILDEALWRGAEQAGVDARQQTAVTRIEHNGEHFVLDCGGTSISARIVIKTAGRHSNLRLTLRTNEPHFSGPQSAPSECGPSTRFLGLKAHFHEPDAMLSTDLYFFEGGYCGVQPVGNGVVNACGLVCHGVANGLSEVLELNPELLARSRRWTQAVAEVRTFPAVFNAPRPVKEGLLCAGDAAGFIDPFLGDGISLALRTGETAGRIAAGALTQSEAATQYAGEYQARFAGLFTNAARMRKLLTAPRPVRLAAMRLLSAPRLANYLAKATR